MPIEKPTIERPVVEKPTIDRASIQKKIKRISKKKPAPRGHQHPNFWDFMDDPDAGDPFAGMQIDPDALVEDVADQEAGVMSDTLRRIVEEKRERRRKYQLLTDGSYYCVLVFQSFDQKMEFFDKAGWDDLNDSVEGMYINGLEVADRMGIDLNIEFIPTKPPPKAPVKLRDPNLIIGGETS